MFRSNGIFKPRKKLLVAFFVVLSFYLFKIIVLNGSLGGRLYNSTVGKIYSRNIYLGIISKINRLDYQLDVNDYRFTDIGENQVILNRTTFNYILNPAYETCAFKDDLEDAEERSVFLLCLVMITPNKLKERLQIRSTWSNREWFRNTKTVFVIGKSKDEAVNRQLVKENEVYNDIVQTDFIDSYKNLSLKSMSGIKWAITYCSQARFVLKIDDDVVVNTKYYLNYLLRNNQLTRTIICNRNFFSDVARNKNKKNYMSYEAYPDMFYPVYCDGSAYTMTMDMAKALYAISKYSRYMIMEDVFITGILAKRVRARYIDLRVRYSRRDDFFFTDILKYPFRKYFIYANNFEDFNKKWNSFLPY